MTPWSATHPARCRHCAQPLTPLQQCQGASCGAAACRHRDALARMDRLARTIGRQALHASAPRLLGRPARLLWLQATEERLVPLPTSRREAHQAHLQALLDAPRAADVQPLAPAAPAASLGAQEWRLCAQCGGRCCGHGAQAHAFISLPQLLRWQHAHAGQTLQEAAASYLERLPAEHVDGSCVYHGAQGCVLPREDRADICNAYACAPLVQVQAELRDDAQTAFATVTLRADVAARQALITTDGTHPLA